MLRKPDDVLHMAQRNGLNQIHQDLLHKSTHMSTFLLTGIKLLLEVPPVELTKLLFGERICLQHSQPVFSVTPRLVLQLIKDSLLGCDNSHNFVKDSIAFQSLSLETCRHTVIVLVQFDVRIGSKKLAHLVHLHFHNQSSDQLLLDATERTITMWFLLKPASEVHFKLLQVVPGKFLIQSVQQLNNLLHRSVKGINKTCG